LCPWYIEPCGDLGIGKRRVGGSRKLKCVCSAANHGGEIDAARRIEELAIDLQGARGFSIQKLSVHRECKVVGSGPLELTKRDRHKHLQYAYGSLAAHPYAVFVVRAALLVSKEGSQQAVSSKTWRNRGVMVCSVIMALPFGPVTADFFPAPTTPGAIEARDALAVFRVETASALTSTVCDAAPTRSMTTTRGSAEDAT
jgi:hypothetical protein